MELNNNLSVNVDLERDNENTFTCTICMEDKYIDEECITNCNHIFCKNCIHEWFEKKKTSCPSCRSDIEYYLNKKQKNIIVKVKEENSESRTMNNIIIENERMLRKLQAKVYKLNLFICFNIGYLLYSLFLEGSKNAQIMYYEDKYENCSIDLTNLENIISERNEYIIYNTNRYYKCDIPDIYISPENCKGITTIP